MKIRSTLAVAVAISLTATACSKSEPETNAEATAMTDAVSSDAIAPVTLDQDANPFLVESTLFLQYPPYDLIQNEHYLPAFQLGMAEQIAEIEAIANNPEAPTFENTLVAMELTGKVLSRVSRVFYAMASANTNDTIESVRSEMAPQLAAHRDAILLNPALFERVQAIYAQRDDLDLDPESYRLIEETYTDFVRAGARLNDAEKEQLMAYNAELATLQTRFSQNVLGEVNAKAIVVDDPALLDGLGEAGIAAAAVAAEARGLEGQYVIPMLNTSGQPALASLTDRDLRLRIADTSLGRGSSGGEFDNRETLTRAALIRAERAELLGYPNHAAYGLENQTAQTVEAVNERLASLAPPSLVNAQREAAELQAMIDAEGGDFELTFADWSYYTEKLRKQKFDFDAAQLKPYFELDSVLINGVFFAAEQVFGLTFEQRTDLPVYHPDVRVWEVFEADGSTLGLFVEDMYARESKRGGAWMNSAVSQSELFGTKPVVANHLNIPKPPPGEPTLLTWDEVTTLFHEFGHALHGLFSDVKYPSFSGTSVPRDFVEYPSQVNEMWADWPEVLANYAVHYETGEPLPQEMLDKVLASSMFNEGYRTTEYLAAALLDQAWHQLSPEEVPSAEELLAFEAQALEAAGIAFDPVPPRYRSAYFSHIVGGYSAGYYAYIWSEVLDADSVEWFKENGGMLRENGDHFRATLLSQGGSKDAMELFVDFRGREPDVQPLLIRRGLTVE